MSSQYCYNPNVGAIGFEQPKRKKYISDGHSVRSKKEIIGLIKAVEVEVSALFEPGVTDRNDGISECLSLLSMKRASMEQEVTAAEEEERRATEEYMQSKASSVGSWFSSSHTTSALQSTRASGDTFGLSSIFHDTLNDFGSASVTSGIGSDVAATGSGGEQG